MVKVADIKIGQEISNEFDGITRELLREYAKASGDTNPIHTSDEIAEKAGLKGIIAHGLFSFGFITKLFEDFLEYGKYGNLIETDVDMRAMVRPGDLLITKATVKDMQGKKVTFNVEQTTITYVEVKDKKGTTVKQYEAGERGWISEKDIEQGLVKTKDVPEGILTYRERLATPGTAIIEFLE
jgi:acyl dehydratase